MTEEVTPSPMTGPGILNPPFPTSTESRDRAADPDEGDIDAWIAHAKSQLTAQLAVSIGIAQRYAELPAAGPSGVTAGSPALGVDHQKTAMLKRMLGLPHLPIDAPETASAIVPVHRILKNVISGSNVDSEPLKRLLIDAESRLLSSTTTSPPTNTTTSSPTTTTTISTTATTSTLLWDFAGSLGNWADIVEEEEAAKRAFLGTDRNQTDEVPSIRRFLERVSRR